MTMVTVSDDDDIEELKMMMTMPMILTDVMKLWDWPALSLDRQSLLSVAEIGGKNRLDTRTNTLDSDESEEEGLIMMMMEHGKIWLVWFWTQKLIHVIWLWLWQWHDASIGIINNPPWGITSVWCFSFPDLHWRFSNDPGGKRGLGWVKLSKNKSLT